MRVVDINNGKVTSEYKLSNSDLNVAEDKVPVVIEFDVVGEADGRVMLLA